MEARTTPKDSSDPADRFRGLEFRGARSSRGTVSSARVSLPSPPAWGIAPTVPPEEAETGTIEEQAFLEFALARGKQSVANYRLVPLLRRLPACLRALKVDTLAEARALLEAQPDLTTKVLDSLLIGATSFYRDAPVFDCLGETVLPRLFASHERIRVLSSACSDGAELYTVAALVHQQGRLADAELWGIDCRESALAKARKGRYAESSFEQFPEALRNSYLTPVGSQLQVREDLLAATNWAVGNALFPSERGSWNLILCRNLAIYLRTSTCATLWRHTALALEPGGYLVVGRAEKPVVPGLSQVGPCTYRKDF